MVFGIATLYKLKEFVQQIGFWASYSRTQGLYNKVPAINYSLSTFRK